MDCEDVRARLHEALDGGGGPPADIREHNSACDDCREAAEALRRTHAMLADDPDLAWTPALTAGVMLRVRRERSRSRWFAVAAAAMILLAAWIGLRTVAADPTVSSAVRTVSGAVPTPESPESVLSAIYDGAVELAADADSALGSSPLSAGLPAAAGGALLALLLLNGLVIGRPLVARRRRT